MSTAAVLVSGQMRTLNECLPSIKQHVLDWLGPHHIFVHAAYDEDAHDAHLLNPTACTVQVQPTLDEKNYVHRTGRGVYGVQPVLRQLWSLRESWRVMEASGIPKPDWVVRLRPDCEFTAPVEPRYLVDHCEYPAVWVPTFHNFHGLCDRFAFGNYEGMRVYCNRFDNLDEYVAGMGIFQPETHLEWTMRQAGVSVYRTKAQFNLVRKNGQRVRPSWNEGCDYGDVRP